jgi:excisionase family DNA binding protein
MSNIKARSYSISEAARDLGVRRTTLYEWIRKKVIPVPKLQFVSSIRLRVWTEEQMDKIREYKANKYWGKGVDRRTGKKAKNT